MNLTQLKESGQIFFECVAGSHAYGTNVSTSDVDLRGFFMLPDEAYLSLIEPPQQIGDTKHDITYYSMMRAFELLQTANPNMIELLWMPEDCIRIKTPIMDKLIENRDLFISKKCFHTHSGYAFAQIKKAKGQNKKVHNPQPKEQPKKEDFCWVIMASQFRGFHHFDTDIAVFPARPKPLSETGVDLSCYHATSLEHSHNIYRLYNYEDSNPKGVFRGNDMLACESIPIEDEWNRFAGILIYNQDMFERALKDHKSYWDWMNNRNDARWVDQEKGKLNYDQKNLMHCLRLLMSGENILKCGYPLVRFEGEQKKFLMQIRKGEMEYDYLMEEVTKKMSVLEELYNTSNVIPDKVNVKKINNLYKELRS